MRALYHVVITSDGHREEESVTVGRTVDVSETGVRLETPGHLCIDDEVRLEIAVEETVVKASGRVVHAARTGELIEAESVKIWPSPFSAFRASRFSVAMSAKAPAKSI